MIKTSRLYLRPIQEAFAKPMLKGLSDKQLYTFIPDEPPSSLQELQSRYRVLQDTQSQSRNEIWLNWIIFKQSHRTPIGYVQSTVQLNNASQIAYLLFAEHWKFGFATEAVDAVQQYVFEHYDTPSIDALIDTRNLASQAVVINLGFQLTETIRNADFFKGHNSDEYRYTKFRDN